ncbi:MAG: YgiQ family radical SAM protein, partial [Bacillota bacterium]|nr:YgiQ family radical SAM protein [Bacillota bacterium]
MPHLPMTRSEMDQYGWDELDFLFINGDACVDHPSFGCAIITRVLETAGYRVGIIAQPNVDDPECLLPMGRPRLGVLVSSGVVDSMVNHYTAAGKLRSRDAYSPGGLSGKRPDRALIRYGQMVRSQFGRIPLIIGGIEASLRRFAHYDCWSDSVRRSILQDSAADLLVFGEGEQTIIDIARYLDRGISVERLNALQGTAVLMQEDQLPRQTRAFLESCASWQGDFSRNSVKQQSGRILPEDNRHVLLPSAEQVVSDVRAFAIAGRYQEQQQDPGSGKVLIQPHGDRYLVQNPPSKPLTAEALDRIYALPYERSVHPFHAAAGPVPALEEVRFSITAHRGCYGGCHFCAITHHM